MPRETTRNALAGAIVGSFIGSLAGLYAVPIPAANKDLIVFMLGQLSGFAGGVMGFNFGTSKSSADKTIALNKALDGPTGKPDDPVTVHETGEQP